MNPHLRKLPLSFQRDTGASLTFVLKLRTQLTRAIETLEQFLEHRELGVNL
jgi:hypothetical protein